MGVQLVEPQYNPLRLRVADLDQLFDLVRPVFLGAVLGHGHPASARARLTDQEAVHHAPALVLVIDPRRLPRPAGQRGTYVAEPLLAHFIHAALGRLRGIGARIDGQHVLPPPDELAVRGRREAPLLLQPGLASVCLSTRRTVGGEIASTPSSSTSLSASRRKVQRPGPAGGSLQVRAINRASCSPSSFRAYTRRGARRFRAASKPASTNCCRIR